MRMMPSENRLNDNLHQPNLQRKLLVRCLGDNIVLKHGSLQTKGILRHFCKNCRLAWREFHQIFIRSSLKNKIFSYIYMCVYIINMCISTYKCCSITNNKVRRCSLRVSSCRTTGYVYRVRVCLIVNSLSAYIIIKCKRYHSSSRKVP